MRAKRIKIGVIGPVQFVRGKVNFEFELLEFVWYLGFGAWNFFDFIYIEKQFFTGCT